MLVKSNEKSVKSWDEIQIRTPFSGVGDPLDTLMHYPETPSTRL